ncbi:MAG TPA: PQQ-binding-like beta-propeller repeat protein [Tepidisphaeraceae bacterium]|nr:PQQ-binding-like beta-propeller repeat protein [Tepidisphaeraceae bacterium]
MLFALISLARADFRFVHTSDPHVNTQESEGSNAWHDAQRYKEISVLDPQPAFIIQTGDIVEVGTVEEYDVYHRVLQHLKVPRYDAPGNHDVRWNPIGKEGYVKGVGQPLYQSWDYENVHFVTLDSTVLLQHWGHISQEQLDWLKADLEKVGPERPVVIGFHHWIGREKVQVDNEQKLMDLVAPYNVVLWLQGHGHSDIQWSINGVPAIMQKGLYQGSYSVIDVTADEMRVRRRAIGPPKKNAELVRDKSVPSDPEVTWTEVMTIPLKKQTPPKWDAQVTASQEKLTIVAKRGDLPDDAQLSYRINQDNPIGMTARGDEWVAEHSTRDLVPGEHVVTVQAVLSDGRAYQKPVALKLELPGAPKPLWSGTLNGAVQSRLVRAGDGLFVTTMAGDCVALDPRTGEQRWRVKTGGPVFSTPHVDGGVVYFGSADHHVYAVEATSGNVKWKYKTGGGVFAGPAVARGVVVIPSVDKKIYGLDAATGEVKWTLPIGGMVQSKCATDGERVFIGDWVNTLRAIGPAKGEQLWEVKMGRTAKGIIATPYSPAIASPAVGDGKVYITTNDGVLHALDTKTGHMVWEWWEKDKNKLGYSGPLFHDGRIYVAIGDEGRTFCLDAAKGDLIWSCDTDSVIYDSSFAFAAGNVFIGNVSGQFNAIDAQSGKIAWMYRLAPGHLLASPATDENTVYIATMSGQIVALPAKVPAVAQTRKE